MQGGAVCRAVLCCACARVPQLTAGLVWALGCVLHAGGCCSKLTLGGAREDVCGSVCPTTRTWMPNNACATHFRCNPCTCSASTLGCNATLHSQLVIWGRPSSVYMGQTVCD